MTLVLIIRQIDLSVGYGAGFMGAIAAIFMIRMGISVWITIPLILLLGIGTGLIQGLIIE